MLTKSFFTRTGGSSRSSPRLTASNTANITGTFIVLAAWNVSPARRSNVRPLRRS